jgi:probable O-glycosylation ligase (exosortase A-associated)
MLMLTALLVCLAATATATWEKRLFRFMSIGTTYRALSTYSRGGFLACCALGLHYFAWSRRRLRTVLALVVVAAIITPALPDSFWMRMRTIETVVPTSSTSLMPGGEEPDDSISGRLHFWSVATSMAADRPFIGVGQNAYNSVYDRYDWSYGRYGFGRSVHSSWFGVLAELGYPGLLLFATLFVGAFATTMRVRHAAKSLPELRNVAAYATAIEASLIVFVVGGAFVPFQYNEMVWHLLALSMAVGRLATAKLGAPTPSVPLSRVSPDVRPAARGRLV